MNMVGWEITVADDHLFVKLFDIFSIFLFLVKHLQFMVAVGQGDSPANGNINAPDVYSRSQD